ncbi:outer membrane beta-barrel protein [uncultured Allomuricauda sp.]|uniref:outer membrane beta-barrel protein n=1 Tax=Flagellimonas sp. W118 TaxID=3410791 RepID=UPI002601AB99|nr:outer membrane beta-barrel protein [uncultured Allomuricauda sp.]
MKPTFRNSIILFSLLFLVCIVAANAQRKEETTQDVPISVDEITEEDLEKAFNSYYAGVGVGVPSGSLGEAASFLYGAFGGYSFKVSKGFSAGPEVNYTHFVGKDRDFGDITVEGEGFDFLGVSARVDYRLSDTFGVGANYGYGTYLEENSDFEDYISIGLDIRPIPGLIIRPEITFQNESELYSVRVSRTF